MRNKIDKNDKYRALVTEFTPYETPLIFSNDHFYENYKRQDIPEILKALINSVDTYAVPYTFTIDKDVNDDRRLSLIHPSIQIKLVDFYDKHKHRIIDSCSISDFSLRYPAKISSIYFNSKTFRLEEQLKDDSIDEVDKEHSHQNTYFAYKRYSHINLFTSSNEFLRAEEDYQFLLKLDIQTCFESIYTHSICWAVKNKRAAKNSTTCTNFENEFDRLMQKSNFNETNGILVGSHTSRIFSEIILQKIDQDIKEHFENKNILFDVNYVIYRYVDDYFIFFNDSTIGKELEKYLTEKLFEYKLSLNLSKRSLTERPFYPPKDIAINKIRGVLSTLEKSITSTIPLGEINLRTPKFKRKNKREDIFSKTVRDIKSIVSEEKIEILDVTAYIQKSLKNILFRMLNKCQEYNLILNDDYFNFFAVFFDLLTYFYSLDRRATASFSFCLTTISLNDFFMSRNRNNIYSLFFLDKSTHFLLRKITKITNSIQKNQRIELYNLSFTLMYLSNNYESSIKKETLNIFTNGNEMTYFDFISKIYLSKELYNNDLRNETISSFEQRIEGIINEDSLKSAEAIFSILDYMACPYIEKQRKIDFLDFIYTNEDIKKSFSKQQIKIPRTRAERTKRTIECIEYSEKYNWFTSWKNFNIRKILQKKELNPTY